jgi:pimeloyl-ACP methyl ester carboxylesterase
VTDVKQIDAGELNIGYVDAGPEHGPVVLLLHGWPYDIHAYDEVTPILVEAGCRMIVPYLRGYGTTRFLSADTPRNGEQVARPCVLEARNPDPTRTTTCALVG